MRKVLLMLMFLPLLSVTGTATAACGEYDCSKFTIEEQAKYCRNITGKMKEPCEQVKISFPKATKAAVTPAQPAAASSPPMTTIPGSSPPTSSVIVSSPYTATSPTTSTGSIYR